MKTAIVTAVALVALVAPLSAMTPTELIHSMRGHVNVQRVDTHRRVHHKSTHRTQVKQKLAHSRTIERRFHSLAEYKNMHRHPKIALHHRVHKTHPRKHYKRHHVSRTKHAKVASGDKFGHYEGNGWYVDDYGRYDEQYEQENTYRWVPSKPIRRQHAYRHYRRQWYLTYLYERAEFDDKYGYHYGYFDHKGFAFDGAYYAYDRSYTYQDRLHGKGLFEHRFYRPIPQYDGEKNCDYCCEWYREIVASQRLFSHMTHF